MLSGGLITMNNFSIILLLDQKLLNFLLFHIAICLKRALALLKFIDFCALTIDLSLLKPDFSLLFFDKLALIKDLSVKINFQCSHLVDLQHIKFFVSLIILIHFFKVWYVFICTLKPTLQRSMQRVQTINLGLKFNPCLRFFFTCFFEIIKVLRHFINLFFKCLHFFFISMLLFFEIINFISQIWLIFEKSVDFLLVFWFYFIYLFLVVDCQLLNHSLVIGFTAEL